MSEQLQPGPMAGVVVVEVAAWVAAPAAGAILSDWGADVIKVEPLDGDPFRGIITMGGSGINAAFELDNRGKRSVSIDIGTPDGRDVLERLIATADVFLTNLRPVALEKLQIDPVTLLERHPRLVFANVTGYGHHSEFRDRQSYDIGGFWARSGVAASHTIEGGEPPILRGGMGDHITAMTMAGGISAALFERERTGVGRHVTTSLVRTGAYAVGQDFNVLRRTGMTYPMGQTRSVAGNPMMNTYRCADGTWVWMLGLQPDRLWPFLLIAMEREDLLADERFAGLAERRLHAVELVGILDEEFLKHPRDEWARRFTEHGVWFEPILSVQDALDDPVVAGAGTFIDVPGPDGPIPSVASPVDFPGREIGPTRPTPDLGQHTDEILLGLGLDDDRIIELKIAGAVL